MNNKKVLFLSLYTFGLTGGIEKVCRSVTKALGNLNEAGSIAAHHCLSVYDTETDSRYADAVNFSGFSGKRITFGLNSIREGLKSDIVMLSHVNLLIFAWLIKALKPKTRVILFAHGIEIWKPLRNWKRKFLQRKVEILAVSKYTADCIQQKHHIEAQQINILNNCLDPFFEPPVTFEKPFELMERYAISRDKKILFTLTRLSSQEQYKGYDQVLAAMKNLPENVHYIIGGKADTIEAERIKQLIVQYGLQKRVTLTGFIADEEITGHYLLADIYVMPSKAEGFGISFIEASACGCKVIAGNQDGSSAALLNGALGTLIDPNDSAQLQSAILEALELPASPLLQQEKTLAHFSFSHYQHKLHQLLTHS
ncbi:glycosyltransferase family 4 protein [Pedobacter aquatilis]|uniref:glycosyltransferase family 4 protein n=1 Tax=Pedobacter aquatilis TaxID=351343 RepID=UPI00292FCD29|nr:glycosyltransferase family 4 protein [Pedobacter aquatilis]